MGRGCEQFKELSDVSIASSKLYSNCTRAANRKFCCCQYTQLYGKLSELGRAIRGITYVQATSIKNPRARVWSGPHQFSWSYQQHWRGVPSAREVYRSDLMV